MKKVKCVFSIAVCHVGYMHPHFVLTGDTLYSAPDREAEYCDERVCLSVCVCLSAIISSELHLRSSPNFLCMLLMAVARSFSGGVLIRYVFPVLWIS